MNRLDLNSPTVMPLGKYKGRPLEEVLIDDPSYLEWLTGQDWFRTKHVQLYQIIINRGAQSEDTPEHNALQVLFLDAAFRERFAKVYLQKNIQAEKWSNKPLKLVGFEIKGIDVVIDITLETEDLIDVLALLWQILANGKVIGFANQFLNDS
jgi:uncharacterized protein (DUF3820 family)